MITLQLKEAKEKKIGLQIFILILIQLSNWRWSWPYMLLTGMLAPFITVAGIGYFADNQKMDISYILAGGICMSLLFETQNRIATNFAFMKQTGAFDFYGALPIRKECIILATLTAFIILALPSVLVTVFAGAWILGLGFHISWQLLPLLLFCLITPAIVGTFIGISVSNIDAASSFSLGLTFLMLAAGPVIVPAEKLSSYIKLLGYFNPAMHASALIRAILFGKFDDAFLMHISILVGFTLLGWLWVRQKMNWQN